MRISKLFNAALFSAGILSAFTAGCSGSGDTTDAASIIEPLPYELSQDDIKKDAVVAELSEAFFLNINQNWKQILQRLIIGTNAMLDVPELSGADFNEDGDVVIPLHIPCQEIEADGVKIRLCDGGKGKCVQNADGEMTTSCEIALIGKKFELQPTYKGENDGIVMAYVTAALDTGKTGLQLGINAYGFSPDCKITYKNGASTTVSGGLRLSLDSVEPNPLHFELAEVSDGVYLNGLNDLDIGTSGNETIKLDCGTGYNILLSLLKPSTILGLFSDKIQSAVKDAVDKAVAQPCTWLNDDENDLKGGPCRTGLTCACFDSSKCKKHGDMRCKDNKSGKFVTLYPGYDGRVKVGKFLSSMGADPAAAFDFSAMIGGSLGLYEGRPVNGLKTGSVELGAVLGLKSYPDETSYCVPPMEPRDPLTVTAMPDFDKEGPSGHQLGLVISEATLNNALYQATRSGVLCLRVGSELSSMISSALFSGFVPSLALLGDDLPMQLAIRPTQAPFLTFGENTVSGGKISDPLTTINLNGLEVDFYAMVEDRMTRLFTLSVDVTAPLALEVTVDEETHKTMVHPVLGSLTKMIKFNDIDHNSELLVEDIGELGDQLSGLLGLADTILAGVISSYPLPDLFGLRLSFDGFSGLGTSQEGTKPYVGGFFSVSLPEEEEEAKEAD